MCCRWLWHHRRGPHILIVAIFGYRELNIARITTKNNRCGHSVASAAAWDFQAGSQRSQGQGAKILGCYWAQPGIALDLLLWWRQHGPAAATILCGIQYLPQKPEIQRWGYISKPNRFASVLRRHNFTLLLHLIAETGAVAIRQSFDNTFSVIV